MLTLKVLGSGCPNCKALETRVREALDHTQKGLKEDRRTVRARPHGWRLTPQAREVLDGE